MNLPFIYLFFYFPVTNTCRFRLPFCRSRRHFRQDQNQLLPMMRGMKAFVNIFGRCIWTGPRFCCNTTPQDRNACKHTDCLQPGTKQTESRGLVCHSTSRAWSSIIFSTDIHSCDKVTRRAGTPTVRRGAPVTSAWLGSANIMDKIIVFCIRVLLQDYGVLVCSETELIKLHVKDI